MQGSTLPQLAAISGLLKLHLDHCQLTTIKGLELLPALQKLTLPEVQLQPVDLAPLSALTALAKLDAPSAVIADECSALLRLPSLAWLHVNSISLSAPPAAGALQQLTYLEVASSGSLPSLLSLPKLEHLRISTIEDGGDDGASLVAMLSEQTSLTQLKLESGLSQEQMQQMVAPLKKLQCFDAAFATDETSCLAACTALAELPLLRELTLRSVPQPVHLAILARCTSLQDIGVVTWSDDVGDVVAAKTLLLAALVCKPGLRHLAHPYAEDDALMEQMAAKAGVANVLHQMAAHVGVNMSIYNY